MNKPKDYSKRAFVDTVGTGAVEASVEYEKPRFLDVEIALVDCQGNKARFDEAFWEDRNAAKLKLHIRQLKGLRKFFDEYIDELERAVEWVNRSDEE